MTTKTFKVLKGTQILRIVQKPITLPSATLLARPHGISEKSFQVNCPLNITAVLFFLPLCLLWSLTHWTQLNGWYGLVLTHNFSLLVLTGNGEREVDIPLQMFWSSAFSSPIHVVTVVRGSAGPMYTSRALSQTRTQAPRSMGINKCRENWNGSPPQRHLPHTSRCSCFHLINVYSLLSIKNVKA